MYTCIVWTFSCYFRILRHWCGAKCGNNTKNSQHYTCIHPRSVCLTAASCLITIRMYIPQPSSLIWTIVYRVWYAYTVKRMTRILLRRRQKNVTFRREHQQRKNGDLLFVNGGAWIIELVRNEENEDHLRCCHRIIHDFACSFSTMSIHYL